MPVVLRHNEKLELSRVDYAGVVTGPELRANAGFNQANPQWLGFDCLSLILEGAIVGALTTADLDAILASYERTVFSPNDLLIQRRSSWLCLSPQAQPFLTHWLKARGANQNMWSDIRQFDTFEAAADWLLLTRDGMEALKSGEGFTEIARFDHVALNAATR